MSKRKVTKKRQKAYTGPDAATGPRVTRYTINDENALTAWWKENKRVSLFRGVLTAVAVLIAWLIYAIIN